MSAAHLIPELDRKGLRDFALVTGGIVAALFGLLIPWLLGRPLPLWPWVLAGVLGTWGLVAPTTLRPVYRGWMRFGLLMSKVVTPLIMGIVFFLLITPLGLVRRALARDEIPKHPNPSAPTYRVPSKKLDPKRLKRPF